MFTYFFLSAVFIAAAFAQGPKQPLPFSHKQHAAASIKCVDCHTIRKPGFAAGIPAESTCMGCHITVKAESESIQKLAEFAKAKKPIPWVKVYRLPDYVWFSHEVHFSEAKVECATCHGPVAEREVISREKPINMKSCMDCHDKHQAPNECDVCHDKR